MKTSKVTTSSIVASLYDIFSRRRKSDVTGLRALNANDVIGMQTISATKSTNCIVKTQPVHSSISPEIPVIVIEHDDNDDGIERQGSDDVTTGDQSSPTFYLPHSLATADEDDVEMGDSGSRWKPQLCKRKSSSLECLTDVKKEDEDWLSTAQDDGRLVKKRPLSRAPPFSAMGFPCMGYSPSVTTSKPWEGFGSKSSSTTSLLGKSSSSGNLSSSRERRNSVYSVENALVMAIYPVSETILEKSDVSSLVSVQTERSVSSVTSSCGGGGSTNSHHSSRSFRGNGAVPRIPLKRREGLYAEEAALMQQRRKERSASISSVQSFLCPSPLLHLSASELFLQAADDGRSMTSSMTSLSVFSGASCSSGASDSSNDSGVGGVGVKNRRSVSFSGSDGNAAKDFRPRNLSENSWRERFDDAADPESDARSTVSCNVYTIGGNLSRPRPRRCSTVRSLLTPHVPHATPGLGRPRSESCSDLSLHLQCGGSGSNTIPLRCSRGRSVSCLSLNSLGSDPECDEGVLFTVRFYNRIGKKVDRSDALSNLSHVYHLYKGMLLLTDILESKITFLASNGRAVKEFLAEAGSQPWNSCVTNKGHVAVTLRRQSCVTVWSGNGSLVREFGHDVLQCPTGLACDQKGRFIVSDEQTNRVAIFNEAGKFVRYLCHKAEHARNVGLEEFGEPAARGSNSQRQCGEEGSHDDDDDDDDNNNNKNNNEGKITDMRNCRTKKFQRRRRAGDGDSGSSVGETEPDQREEEEEAPVFQFSLPRYVWVTRRGKILVSDSGSHSVKVFSEDGVFLRSIGTHGTGDGQLKVPYGVCCDQEENVYIADHYNDRVSVFTIDGEFVQHVLTAAAGLSRPKSLAIRCGTQERKLYVAHGGLRSTEVTIYRLFTGKPQTQQAVTFKCDI